jgi:transposase
MRGGDIQQSQLFSYGSLEDRIPPYHPLRAIRVMTDEVLSRMNDCFGQIYAAGGRPSIAPERLLRATLVQMLYSVPSERMLMEQLNYNLLFRWFVGLAMDEPVWHPTVFTKNRDRLLEAAVAEEFLTLVIEQARERQLLSNEHFTVDGTLIEAWASHKSFRPKRGGDDPLNPPPTDRTSNPTVNWHKQRRSNETHESTTDPMARLYKKTRGVAARLAYMGHLLTENRNGLIVDACLTQATGTAEREAALEMLSHKPANRAITVAADKAYDQRAFVEAARAMNATPHVAQNGCRRRSAIDARTTRHDGYLLSQRRRKLVEEAFGWMKTIALQRKTRFRGLARVGFMFNIAAAAYNLIRIRNLSVQAA